MSKYLTKLLTKAFNKLIIFAFIANFAGLFVANLAYADNGYNESVAQQYVGAEQSNTEISPNNPAYQFYKAHVQPKEEMPTSINTQELGVRSPIKLTGSYNDELGWAITAQYTKLLSQSNAISILLTYGEKQIRANLTYAHAFNKHQRLKLSAEYLRQKLPFDFASGKVNEWIGQGALGADYQYLFDNGSWLHSIDLIATYSKANSKNLSTLDFVNDGVLTEDFRHIAGGRELTLGGKLSFLPTNSILLSVGAAYDNLKYDTKYDSTNSKEKGLGLSAGAKILLGANNEITGSFNRTVAENTYQVGLNHIFKRFEVGITGAYNDGRHGLMSSKEIGLQITFNPPKSFSFNPGAGQSLQDWASTPAVYRQQVLAIKDEKLVAIGIPIYQLPEQIAIAGTAMIPVNSAQLFNINSAVFTNVIYTAQIKSLNPAAGNDSTPNHPVTMSSLGLSVQPYSNTQANIVGNLPTWANELSPYKISVTATAYANGSELNSVQNSFELKVDSAGSLIWDKDLPSIALANMPFNDNIAGDVTVEPVGTKVTFTKLSGPSWLKVSNAGQLSGTPTNDDSAKGAVDYKIQASSWTASSHQITTTKEGKITVIYNSNPVDGKNVLLWNTDIGLPTNVKAGYNQSFDVSKKITNTTDDNSPAFSEVSGPNWITITTAGAITIGTVPENAAGQSFSYTLKVTANTGDVGTVSNEITKQITVDKLGKLAPPTWNTATPTIDATVGVPVQANLTKFVNYDKSNGEHLEFANVQGYPDWLKGVSSDGAVLGTPTVTATFTDNPRFWINVRAVKGNQVSDWVYGEKVHFNIAKNKALAPKWQWMTTTLPAATVNTPYSFDFSKYIKNYGNDQDNATVQIVSKNTPWLKLESSNNYVLSGTPTKATNGKVAVELSATNIASGVTVNQTVYIQVEDKKVTPPASWWAGAPYPDGQTIKSGSSIPNKWSLFNYLTPKMQTELKGDTLKYSFVSSSTDPYPGAIWLRLNVNGQNSYIYGTAPVVTTTKTYSFRLRITAYDKNNKEIGSSDSPLATIKAAPAVTSGWNNTAMAEKLNSLNIQVDKPFTFDAEKYYVESGSSKPTGFSFYVYSGNDHIQYTFNKSTGQLQAIITQKAPVTIFFHALYPGHGVESQHFTINPQQTSNNGFVQKLSA